MRAAHRRLPVLVALACLACLPQIGAEPRPGALAVDIDRARPGRSKLEVEWADLRARGVVVIDDLVVAHGEASLKINSTLGLNQARAEAATNAARRAVAYLAQGGSSPVKITLQGGREAAYQLVNGKKIEVIWVCEKPAERKP